LAGRINRGLQLAFLDDRYVNVTGDAMTGALTITVGGKTLTLTGGSITDSSGAISFGNENVSTTGTIGCGALNSSGLIDAATGINLALLLGADVNANTRTNSVRKFARIGMPHYLTAEEEVLLFSLDSDGTDNKLNFGGGSSNFNTATEINFLVGATDTTTLGTAKMQISAAGVGLGEVSFGVPVTPQSILHIFDEQATIRIQNKSADVGDAEGIIFKGTNNISADFWNMGIFAERTNLGFSTGLSIHIAADATAAGIVTKDDAVLTVTQTKLVGIGTASPDTKLQVVGDAKIGDDNTNYVEVGTTGDITFVGTAGLPFADISVYNNGTAATISTGTWAQMTRFDTDGENNNCTPDHTNDHITITKAGRYMVNVSASFSGDPNITWYGGVWKNNGGTQLQNMQIHRKLGAGGDVGCVSMSGIGDFAVNDTVEIWIRQDSGADKAITIVDCCLAVSQVGGT